MAGDERAVPYDPDRREWEPHAGRRLDRRWQHEPEHCEPLFDLHGITCLSAKRTFAGRSASRRMYHGYHAVPYATSVCEG